MIAERQERLAAKHSLDVPGGVLAPPGSPPGRRRGWACRPAIRLARSPMTKTSRMAGDRQVGLDQDPPRAVERHPQRTGQRRGRHPRGPEHGPGSDPLGADADPLGIDRPSRSCRCGPRLPARASCSRAFSDSDWSRSEGRTRGEPSSRITCAWVGSMCRKSLARAWRAISLRAPASSTPVGPPPTITNVSQARRAAGSSLALGRFEGVKDATADLQGVADALESRGVGFPFVVTEIRMRHAGRHDQVVVGDRSPHRPPA